MASLRFGYLYNGKRQKGGYGPYWNIARLITETLGKSECDLSPMNEGQIAFAISFRGSFSYSGFAAGGKIRLNSYILH